MFFLTETLVRDRMADLRREADQARRASAARSSAPRRTWSLPFAHRAPVVAVPGVGSCRPRPVA